MARDLKELRKLDPEAEMSDEEHELWMNGAGEPISKWIYLWCLTPFGIGGLIAGLMVRDRNRQVSNRLFAGFGIVLCLAIGYLLVIASMINSLGNAIAPEADRLGQDSTGQYASDYGNETQTDSLPALGYPADEEPAPMVLGPAKTTVSMGFKFEAAMGDVTNSTEENGYGAKPGNLKYRLTVQVTSLQTDRSATFDGSSIDPVFMVKSKSNDPCGFYARHVRTRPRNKAYRYCYTGGYSYWDDEGEQSGTSAGARNLAPGETAQITFWNIELPEGLDRNDFAVVSNGGEKEILLYPN